MYTYQDLLAVGDNDAERCAFCFRAIEKFRGSIEYREAAAGEAYYAGHNMTIERFEKFLYTMTGKKVKDVYSANYKLKSRIFRRLTLQQVQYVLGNGLILGEPTNKEKLGANFDYKLVEAAKRAMAGGRAFGFWNMDHLEVFGFADTPASPGFCPLDDEETSELAAGIRFWYKRVGDKLMTYATLYEEDGYTKFIKRGADDMNIIVPKKAYVMKTRASEIGGIEEIIDENPGRLPIVTLFANDTHQSELNLIRDSIDCMDLVKSGLANKIDDETLYWLIKNAGGMDDEDVAVLLERLRTLRAAVVDGSDDVSAVNTEVPFEAQKYMLELLRSDMYDDFGAADIKSLTASAKTTQEIQSAYQSQDDKCADFEYHIIDFVQKVLAIAGIDDNPTFRWNKVVNMTEQINMVLSAANYLSDETVIKHLAFLTPEEADEEIAKRELESYNQFNNDNDPDKEDEDDEEDEE